MNNKLVIFDWGGVIEDHHNTPNNWFNCLTNTFKRISPIKNEKEIIYRFTNTTLNINGKNLMAVNSDNELVIWYEELKKRMLLTIELDEFIKVFNEEFDKVYYYQEVVDYAHSLKDICKVGVLSNLVSFEHARIDKELDLSRFDYVWLSYKMGLVKPDVRIYEEVLKETGMNPADILFIDDKEENVVSAKKIGFNVLQATALDLEIIKEEVANFLEK